MGQIQCHTTLLASSSLDADPWSIGDRMLSAKMDLGSVNAPPPLDHRQSGVGWSGDTEILLQRVMPLAKILDLDQ